MGVKRKKKEERERFRGRDKTRREEDGVYESRERWRKGAREGNERDKEKKNDGERWSSMEKHK